MTVYYAIVMFILGTILGSFYNVVAWRLPRGESIVTPGSHCTNCGHRLTPGELIPIFSYLFQGRKCKKCHQKISPFYAIFEAMTGILFCLCYLKYGFSGQLVLSLTFISMLLIIMLSDYQTMIIPDEVLIVTSILLLIEIAIFKSPKAVLVALKNGLLSFFIMWGIKKIGDFLFKKESMGGGDIKLMFVYGIYFGVATSVLTIFASSFIGLPIALIMVKKSSNHEIPFGPFLAIAAIIFVLTGFDFGVLESYLTSQI